MNNRIIESVVLEQSNFMDDPEADYALSKEEGWRDEPIFDGQTRVFTWVPDQAHTMQESNHSSQGYRLDRKMVQCTGTVGLVFRRGLAVLVFLFLSPVFLSERVRLWLWHGVNKTRFFVVTLPEKQEKYSLEQNLDKFNTLVEKYKKTETPNKRIKLWKKIRAEAGDKHVCLLNLPTLTFRIT